MTKYFFDDCAREYFSRGTRTFTPTEYLAAAPRKLMAPGETARAQFEVVDPGPDAYGFELDVCIEVETHVLSCGSDKVFL